MGLVKIPIDFEFNRVNERFVNLVCVAVHFKDSTKSLWLDGDDSAKSRIKKFIIDHKDCAFVSYNATSEALCFISLGLDPLDFNWICLYHDYKMLLNCNDHFEYGPQLKDGKEIVTEPRPEWIKDLNDEIDGWEDGKELAKKIKANQKGKYSTADSNLSACTYKLLSRIIDTEHKTEMRDLIISEAEFTEQNKADILRYCESDVAFLKQIDLALKYEHGKYEDKEADRLWRGRIGAITAKMTSEGYPINRSKIQNLQTNLPIATFDLCESINNMLGVPLFKWNPKRSVYSTDKKLLGEEVHSKYKDFWPKTPTGKYKLDSKTLDKILPTKYSYDNTILHQYKRYMSFYSSTNSLKKSKDEKDFFSRCGSDDRVRAWLNPYGAQSGRFQPAATHFLPLKAAWMRSAIDPRPGKIVISGDFAQQEFLLQGCVSCDEEIYKTYCFGDIYVGFGRKSGLVRSEKGTAEYKIERAGAKSAVLGMGYGMQSESLARKITDDRRREDPDAKETTKQEAEEIIKAYYDLYSVYGEFKNQALESYQRKGYMKLADGWLMYGDNPSKLSVLNVPIQGMGACILRKALEFCYRDGLTPIFPLHDAIYIETATEAVQVDAMKLKMLMKEATAFFFEGVQKEWAHNIRIDLECWGPDMEIGELKLEDGSKMKTEKAHVDERAEQDYEHFKQYFEPMSETKIAEYKSKVRKLGFVNGLRQLNLFQED